MCEIVKTNTNLDNNELAVVPAEEKNEHKNNVEDGLVDDGGHPSLHMIYSFSTTRNDFSQQYPATFIVNKIMFATAEHYVLYCKALFFRDRMAAKKMLNTSSPTMAKMIERRIKNCDVTWNALSRKYVIDSMYHKFEQNPTCKSKLINTEFKLIARFGPNNLLWGTGVYAQHRDALDESSWRGDNWLGECLMLVRAYFKNKIDGKNLYYYMQHIHTEYYYDIILKKQGNGLNGSTTAMRNRICGHSQLLNDLTK